jgi:hypothetical protein
MYLGRKSSEFSSLLFTVTTITGCPPPPPPPPAKVVKSWVVMQTLNTETSSLRTLRGTTSLHLLSFFVLYRCTRRQGKFWNSVTWRQGSSSLYPSTRQAQTGQVYRQYRPGTGCTDRPGTDSTDQVQVAQTGQVQTVQTRYRLHRQARYRQCRQGTGSTVWSRGTWRLGSSSLYLSTRQAQTGQVQVVLAGAVEPGDWAPALYIPAPDRHRQARYR